MHHLLQRLGYLINITLIHRVVSHICIWCGNIRFTITDRMCFGGQGVTCSCSGQFGNGTNISCMKFRYFNRFVPLKNIKLTDFHLNIFINIVNNIIRFQYAGVYFNQGIFTNKRIHNRFPYHCRFCLCEIIVCMENFVGL